MTNMKMDKPQTECAPCYPTDGGPVYPYGLRISLRDEDLAKLGIKDLPAVGDTMTLTAQVQVTRVSDEQAFYGRERCLGLQITDMELSAAKAEQAEGSETY